MLIGWQYFFAAPQMQKDRLAQQQAQTQTQPQTNAAPGAAQATWDSESNPTPDPGVATINTSFTDGSTLAQWMQNLGESYGSTLGQVQISTLRNDVSAITAPTQSWLTLNPASGETTPALRSCSSHSTRR